MTIIDITPDTDWQALVAEHLAAGDRVSLRFETPSMTPQEMADSLGVSRPSIMRWIGEGKITSQRHGNRHRIPNSEVERFRSWYIQDVVDASADDALAELFGDTK
ncbi:helix-turn-helix domain-containing protein [Xylanimonas cellulosilytica]|nr:helix-turn-helix domain-containing protein [Xylanimonas cellulosilytica]